MHYLIIRPISEDSEEIEPVLDRLEVITGLNRLTLKQKLQGSALNLLKHHAERKVLDDISEKLTEEGISSIVVSKKELRKPRKSLRATSIDISSKRIELLSKNNKTLLTIDKALNCLVVISCKNFKKIRTKQLARHVMSFTEPMTPDEKLKAIFVNQPVMEIYSKGSELPIRIDSSRFNFTSLGERNRNSAALNFQIILELISKHANQVIIETGFGENNLPFLRSLYQEDKDRAFLNFAVYSFFVSLAHDRGIFTATTNTKGLIPIPILGELTSIFWAGSVGSGSAKKKNSKDNGASDEDGGNRKNSLPMPPEEFTRSGSKHRTTRILGRRLPDYNKFIRELGPKIIFYPLSVIMLGSLTLLYVSGSSEPLSITVMTAGLMMFSRSFVLIKRKRLIENCPRSKIRSMPMGEVEVGGKAVQKYYLKSPYTYTNCVYYSYKIYHKESTHDGNKWTLKEWGGSGRIPFYLDDSTGRTLILPDQAILHAGVTETLRGDMLSAVFGASAATSDRKIVETTIPTGQFLYVLGYAHRLRLSHDDKKKEMTEKLLDLKYDKARLKEYDTDGDGKISSEEWDVAREDVEHQMLRDRLNAETKRDEVAIGAHPSGGLFIISDKKEEHIIKSMAWKIPLYLIAGSIMTLNGLFFTLKLLKNSGILQL